jgi:hypothetical protein
MPTLDVFSNPKKPISVAHILNSYQAARADRTCWTQPSTHKKASTPFMKPPNVLNGPHTSIVTDTPWFGASIDGLLHVAVGMRGIKVHEN